MKKLNIKIIILLILSILSIVFVYNDYFLYKTPILKIIKIDNKLDDSNTSNEKYYIQQITGKIMNGLYKGSILETNNNYYESLILDVKLEKNTEIFVKLSDDGKQILSIENVKRDKYLVILLVIFVDLIIIVAGKKGLKTIISLLVNILITAFAIIFFKNNYMKINMLVLYLIISIIFIIFSLFITNGKSMKTLSAIISSVVSLFLTFTLSYILINIYKEELYIWNMEYIEVVYDYYNYLYVSILLCGLGAIMDISITVSSALNELINKNPKIDLKSIYKSGKVISKDIVGTMINVMLFTCYTSIIPTIILAVKNHMTLNRALDLYGSMELTIVLCNCIGIVLTIPISLYISVLILRKGCDKDE